MNLMFHTGVVESRDDPLRLGRCKVRVVGIHTEDTTLLPTEDLPWAFPMQPVTSAAMNGIGYSPVGPVPGTWVIIAFQDDAKQFPIMLGTIGGIPQQSLYGQIDADDNNLSVIQQPSDTIQLRTTPSTVAGSNVITFYDPEKQVTDFTSKLVKNMRVSGPGVQDETLIDQIESKDSVRLSRPFGSNGENILSFKSAPTNLDAVKESRALDDSVVTTGSGGILVDGSGNPVRTGSSTQQPTQTTNQQNAPAATPELTPTNQSIPLIPPKGSTRNTSEASAGIKALIAACDRVGLTHKVQKAALLGIVGGESKWQPLFENTFYSESRFRQIFPSIVNKRPESEWKPYVGWDAKTKGREKFFSYLYGPTARGKGFFGHVNDEEAGKYYGRGYIQLTGKSNYIRYNNLARKLGLNIDIVNNPDSLNDDINVCALVSALYIIDRVPKNSPLDARYFEAAKRAVGNNSPDIAAVKKKYFEYFYGEASTSIADKDALPSTPPDVAGSAGVDSNGTVIPSPSSNESRFGFRDPNGKYPLGVLINEPDTNRLARGITKGTAIEVRDNTRQLKVPTANDGSWDQPEAPYGGQYPFNKVFETESGHVMEWDDTPGNERITQFHRAGTYSDIDANGTKVDYIAGDGYVVMSKNGYVYVWGSCNLTVGGQVNILCQSDANIKVEGNTEATFGGNVNIGVAQNLSMSVAQDFSLKVGGNFDVDVGADFASKVKGKVGLSAEGEIQTSTKSKFGLNVTNDIDVRAGNVARLTASGAMELKTDGNMRLDYSRGDFGDGANSASPGTPKDPADATALSFPPVGSPSYNSVEPLESRERSADKEIAGETEEDLATPEGRKLQHEKDKEVAGRDNDSAPAETAPAPSGGKPDPRSKVDCAVILTTDRFTDSYKLTKNFTLGMCVDGGVTGRHRLQNQNLTDTLQGGKIRVYTPQEVVCNLANTVEACLEPLVQNEILPNGMRGYNTLWGVNSGYRLKGVLALESATSMHCKGQAIDIGLRGSNRYKRTFDLVQQVERAIPYDQVILEYDNPTSVWIHIGYNYRGGNRKMAFTMSRHRTYQRDAKGFPSGFVLLEPVNGVFPKRA